MERTSFALIFEQARDKAWYQRTYCEGQCDRCEHYVLLMESKYSDE